MSAPKASTEPGARWDPQKYKIDDFDFQELTGMFLELRTGCGSNFNTYFGLLKKFIMLSYTNCELDIQVKKFLSAELISVHERFVYKIIQICDLPIKTRSLDDILNGNVEGSSKDNHNLPHISSLNALGILYSLAYGWKAPDTKFGELIANAAHTMLRDRIDAALHVRNVPVRNEIGVHVRFQCPSANGDESTNPGCVLTATDFLKSFSSENHFLAAETSKLFTVQCHLNFYKKLRTVVPEEDWDAAIEESIVNAPVLEQKPGGSADGKTFPENPVLVNANDLILIKDEDDGKKKDGVKRTNSRKGPPAKKRPRKRLTNCDNVDRSGPAKDEIVANKDKQSNN